jgi:DNA-binding MarR family transcriptional regulator
MAPSTPDFSSLAAFRYAIRRFLKAGDAAAHDANIEPQQHQVLLAVRARQQAGEETAITDLAEVLLLTHHSTVGLVDRLERRGLVRRERHAVDQRRVQVTLTPEGEDIVTRLAAVHQAQLQLLGPELIASLNAIVASVQAPGGSRRDRH